MKKIKFKIKDVFKYDDKVTIYIIRLFMAINDLKYILEKYLEEKNRSGTKKKGNMLYLLRLNCSRLKEAMDVFVEAQKENEFKNLLNDLLLETKRLVKKLLNLYLDNNGKNTNFVRKVLTPIRNNFFHYSNNNRVKKILKILADKDEESYISTGEKFKDLYFNVCDHISTEGLSIDCKRTGEKGETAMIEMVKNVRDMTGMLINIVDALLKIFYSKYLKNVSNIEDIQ